MLDDVSATRWKTALGECNAQIIIIAAYIHLKVSRCMQATMPPDMSDLVFNLTVLFSIKQAAIGSAETLGCSMTYARCADSAYWLPEMNCPNSNIILSSTFICCRRDSRSRLRKSLKGFIFSSYALLYRPSTSPASGSTTAVRHHEQCLGHEP